MTGKSGIMIMDNKKLVEKQAELEAKLKRKKDAHYKKPHWHSESAYRDSVQEIRDVYDDLFAVSKELGEPIPVWF